MNVYSVSSGSGQCRLNAAVCVSPGGVSVYVCGGDAPHIGSVVLAEPRPSHTGCGMSCTCGVLNILGHKDERVARTLAERICPAVNLPVSVSAGVHIDDISPEQLQLVEINISLLAESILEVLLSALDGPTAEAIEVD